MHLLYDTLIIKDLPFHKKNLQKVSLYFQIKTLYETEILKIILLKLNRISQNLVDTSEF